MQDPPGGPPDFDPPVIVAVAPDSGQIAEGFDDELVIEFDEIVSELGGRLETFFALSPRPEALKVSWKRRRLAIKPRRGWRPNVVYQLRIRPGLTDLQNNRLETGRTVIFSTGGEIPDTRLEGTVIDWENGTIGAGALVEAVLLPDSLVYVARADSGAGYAFGAIPRGRYVLYGAIDRNDNDLRDPSEAFDSVEVQLDSTASYDLWAFVHDSAGPRLRNATALDTVTFRVEFSNMLSPGPPPPDGVSVWLLPDTVPVAVDSVWERAVYDSLTAAARAAADSAAADTAAAVADTADAAPPAPPTPRPGLRLLTGGAQEPDSVVPIDSSRALAVLAQRPALDAAWVVRLVRPLVPTGRYLVRTVARNVEGATAESEQILVVPEAPAPADSTAADSTAADALPADSVPADSVPGGVS